MQGYDVHDAPYHLPDNGDLFQYSIDNLVGTVLLMFKTCLLTKLDDGDESSDEDETEETKHSVSSPVKVSDWDSVKVLKQ